MSSRLILLSLISGCAWAMIALAVAWSMSAVGSTPLEIARTFSGGLIAAPAIGLLVGLVSHKFSTLAWPARMALALADLYFAAWLFLIAAGAVRLLGGTIDWSRAFEAFVSAPILGAVLGLTYAGFVLLLWPLSYANHTLVARVSSR